MLPAREFSKWRFALTISVTQETIGAVEEHLRRRHPKSTKSAVGKKAVPTGHFSRLTLIGLLAQIGKACRNSESEWRKNLTLAKIDWQETQRNLTPSER